MSGNAETYKALIERFRAFATGHYNLGATRFTHGQIDVADLAKFGKYPIMHVVPANISFAAKTANYSFEVFFLDKPPTEEGEKAEYQCEALNDTAEIACDLIAAINPGVLFGEMVSVNLESNATPLIQEFSNVLTGWQLSLSIEVPKRLDACNIPGSFTFINPSTGATGNAGQLLGFGKIAVSGQSTVEAEVANDTVTFVAAGGMTITTNAAGDVVTFTSETGGGGTGDVVGPASSVDSRIALFDGTTGRLLKVGAVGLDHFAVAADTQAQFDNEAEDRANADITLQNNIDNEASNRANADTTIAATVTTETNARIAADLALAHSDFILAATALGSQVKAMGLYGDIFRMSTFVSLTDNTVRYSVIYLRTDETLTGAMFYQAVQGNYTADQTNSIALYSISGGNLTKVAETANNVNLWKKTAQTWHKEPFSAPYNAVAGVYVFASLYNQSAQTTAPGIGITAGVHSAALLSFDLTNSVKFAGTKSGRNTHEASLAMSTITVVNSLQVILPY